MIIMTLVICVLAGLTFPYELENSQNELILLVDVSDTQSEAEYERNQFVEAVLREAGFEGLKVGIVTFGFDQVYAAPLSNDTETVYRDYLSADSPDTTATNIASALQYAADYFEYPETAKIVLVSDGYETDEEAAKVLSDIVGRGIQIDVASFGATHGGDEIQVVGIDLPENNVIVNEPCNIGVTVYSETALDGRTVELYNYTESDVPIGTAELDLKAGKQICTFSVTFTEQGLHKLCARVVTEEGDENNSYFSYVYLTVHDKILVIEQRDGDSERLIQLLEEKYPDEGIVKLNLNADQRNIPKTVKELRAYDQIILNNIANEDLKSLPAPDGWEGEDDTDWFVKNLRSYVYDYGGGLFTAGGSDDSGTMPHAYNREDLYGTEFHDMLPVQAIDYTPPVGVVIVIDISGSMDETRRQGAKNGAIACLNALNDRDYMGVMTLEITYGTALQLTSCTQENRGDIIRAINGIGVGTGTYFSPAIDHAMQALRAEQRISKRHIILITDGMPADKELAIKRAENRGDITLSVVGIDLVGDTQASMKELTDAWGGNTMGAATGTEIMDAVRNDVTAPAIKEYTPKEFYPVIADRLSPIVRGVEYGVEGEGGGPLAIPVMLGGYYGVRARGGAQVIVTGEYEVPIYAQWQYGAGKVGSFMCDLYGEWSGALLSERNGKQLILNIVANLMPAGDIRHKSITLSLKEDNYTNTLSVFDDSPGEGVKIEGEILYQPYEGEEILISLSSFTGKETDRSLPVYLLENLTDESRRCRFVCKGSGTYTITVRKTDRSGNELESVQIFKSFSYSEEYDKLVDSSAAGLLAEIAQKGGGEMIPIDAPEKALLGFRTSFLREFDPTLAFMITAMILFLLDVAVRKFKFKWIHEIIREKKSAQRRI